jgi:hypothetical protein
MGSLTSHNPIGLQGLLRDSFTFTYTCTVVKHLRLCACSAQRFNEPEFNFLWISYTHFFFIPVHSFIKVGVIISGDIQL